MLNLKKIVKNNADIFYRWEELHKRTLEDDDIREILRDLNFCKGKEGTCAYCDPELDLDQRKLIEQSFENPIFSDDMWLSAQVNPDDEKPKLSIMCGWWVESTIINYCPMCGRKLRKKP